MSQPIVNFKISESYDKKLESNNQNNIYSENQFLNVTKRLLLDLATKRKSLKKDKANRAHWSESIIVKQANSQQRPILQNKNQKNIIVIDGDEEMDQIYKNIELEQKQHLSIKSIEQKVQLNFYKKQLGFSKVKLFPLSLKNLTALFLTEIGFCINLKQQKQLFQKNRHIGTVHRAIQSDKSIKNQIQKLVQIIKSPQCWHHFNQDRMIMLKQKKKIQFEPEIFDQQFVTIYQHRGLAMLIKRINSEKYSLHIPQNTQIKNPGKIRNVFLEKFYSQLYQMPLQQYYKKLLELQFKHKRYTGTISIKKKPVIGVKSSTLGPTNFIRKLLLIIFQNKIKGEGQIRQQINKFQTNIYAAIVAQDLLSQMRMKIQGQSKSQNMTTENNEMQDQAQACTGLLQGRKISEKQKLAIQRALQGFKRNRKQVPYPYCMFLQYRLRAQRQPSYNNPQNPSSDEDQQVDQVNKRRLEYKKFRQMNVYRGYRGYKTNNKIAEVRKMNKGISKNVKEFAKQEQFYLKNLPNNPKPLQSKSLQQNKQQNKNKYESKESQVQLIPFPYYLSIFTGNMPQQKNTVKSTEQMQQQIINSLQNFHKQNPSTSVKSSQKYIQLKNKNNNQAIQLSD